MKSVNQKRKTFSSQLYAGMLRAILAFMIGLICLPLHSQDPKIDSLKLVLKKTDRDTVYIDLLNQVANNYNHLNFDSLAAYAREAIRLSREINYQRGLADGYHNLGYAYIPWSRYDSAKAYFDSCLVIANKHELHWLASEAYKGLGILYEESGRYQESIREYFKSLELKQLIDDQSGIGKVHNNLGQAYHNMGAYDSATSNLMKALSNEAFVNDYHKGGTAYLILGMVKFSIGEVEEAKQNFTRALSIFELPDQIIKIATLNALMGKVYFSRQHLDSALYYYSLSLDQFQSIRHLKGVAGLTSRLADTYKARHQYDSAIAFYKKGIFLKREIGDNQFQSEMMLNLAKSYQDQGDISSALATTRQSIQMAESIRSKREALEAYAFLHQLYAQLNRYSDAYGAMQKHLLYRDSVLTEEKINEIRRLETVYEVDKLEREKQQLLEQQKREELFLQSEIKRREIIQYASLAGIVLFLLLFINFYISYSSKKRDNAVIRQQNSQISRAAKQQAETNKKLSELSNFKEALTYMIAHDMKNSLNTIINISSNEPCGEKMSGIGQSGRVMLNLVTNMLDVQKFQEAEVKLNLQSHNLLEIIEESRQQSAVLFQMKSLRFELEAPEKLTIEVDREIMVRVVVNLLTNAIKYSKVGTVITLKLDTVSDEEGHYCLLSVTDKGEGIDPNKLSHIFDKFWQGDARSSGGAASTGLGLTFCKMAVEAHQGEITVESVPGQGTTFHIKLPIKESVANEVLTSRTLQEIGQMVLEEEKETLNRYANELRKLKVYQVGAINSLIERMDDQNIVSPWKKDLQAAVLYGDKDRFDYLLTLIN